MTIIEEVYETFRNFQIGTVFSTSEIKVLVSSNFLTNPSSIIPTDYCYNRFNSGIDFDEHLKIFEYIERGKFRYLGKNYPYSGKVYHKPLGNREFCIGEYKEGIFKKYSNIILISHYNPDFGL
jgi:hypothetical protein